MGVSDPTPDARRATPDTRQATPDVRARHGIPPDATLVAAFGGITPEKRIAQLFGAVSAIAERHPSLHVMLVGAEAPHYDVRAEAARWQIVDRVHITGYVPDAELARYMAAADICACLRWPTNRETSASWLRCLAAGRATIVTELAHLVDVPTIDPRGWQPLRADANAGDPVAVSIDVLDEGHSLQLALERLATDAALRARLGRRAREWWETHHQLDDMAAAYDRLIAQAIARPAPHAALPAHLLADGTDLARALGAALGVSAYVNDALGGGR
jgi:glycosyltransferase involved in cell wall biosynthesis